MSKVPPLGPMQGNNASAAKKAVKIAADEKAAANPVVTEKADAPEVSKRIASYPIVTLAFVAATLVILGCSLWFVYFKLQDQATAVNFTWVFVSLVLSIIAGSLLAVHMEATISADRAWRIGLGGAGAVWLVALLVFFTVGLIKPTQVMDSEVLRLLRTQSAEQDWKSFNVWRKEFKEAGHERTFNADAEGNFRQLLLAAYYQGEHSRLKNVSAQAVFIYLPDKAGSPVGRVIGLRRTKAVTASNDSWFYYRGETSTAAGVKDVGIFFRRKVSAQATDIVRHDALPSQAVDGNWYKLNGSEGAEEDTLAVTYFTGDVPYSGDMIQFDLPKLLDQKAETQASVELLLIPHRYISESEAWEIQPAAVAVYPDVPLVLRKVAIEKMTQGNTAMKADFKKWLDDLDARFPQQNGSETAPPVLGLLRAALKDTLGDGAKLSQLLDVPTGQETIGYRLQSRRSALFFAFKWN